MVNHDRTTISENMFYLFQASYANPSWWWCWCWFLLLSVLNFNYCLKIPSEDTWFLRLLNYVWLRQFSVPQKNSIHFQGLWWNVTHPPSQEGMDPPYVGSRRGIGFSQSPMRNRSPEALKVAGRCLGAVFGVFFLCTKNPQGPLKWRGFEPV